jgi:HPt (histidine-containing phosphotransfer) domain-containing protein
MSVNKEGEALFSIDFIKKHSGGNEQLVREFLNLFISTSEAILEVTQQAINQGNFQEVARQMHKIGPGLNYLSIYHLSKRVKDLELAAKLGTDANLIKRIFAEIEPVLRSCIVQLKALT